ncbi:MAG: class I SAM-dependent DNA methyltransferase [Bradyrhizobium sp.]|nr:class I SAM-dependent DNA methyltransferase [Bradyrhizobium sp.]
MTPEAFISKWQAAELNERAAAQSHFNDLCSMLGEPSPTDVDPKGEWYAFERGATKTTGGEGWADVWKRGCFGWEYKGKRKDLNAAFAQLQQYALALENPPLLVVCDLNRFRIHTNWTNTVSEVHEFMLEDLRDPLVREKLKWTLSDPEKLRPHRTRQSLTEGAAAEFAALALRLRGRGHDPERVAHFINRLIFCMFAEDVDLLPKNVFSRMLKSAESKPEQFKPRAEELFRAMKTGGEAAWEAIEWFNGGLFDDDSALPLDKDDLKLAIRAADLDWAEIDPSILGTLFERGLDPDKRSQLGAHYTDRDKIMLIIEPVVIRPWLAEWAAAKAEIQSALEKEQKAKSPGAKTRAHGEALALFKAFLDRLRAFRVLDPACGSGNFLYLALLALKDLEHRVSIEGEALGFHREFPAIGPASVKGIEINLYAAELARVSVWIGEIQWMRRNGFGVSRNPILKALNTIECRDALLNPDGSEAVWPEADAIVGNPPFLGGKLMRSLLGSDYVEKLFSIFAGRVPQEADLVCYWFVKAWEAIVSGKTAHAGFVATNSMRGGANRRTLDPIVAGGVIYDAWADEPWVLNGAAVRVSMVCFARSAPPEGLRLNGAPARQINTDLTGGASDFTKARRQSENAGVAFMGDTKGGAFDIPGSIAREWLKLPLNPNGRPNADVLKPWMNGMDIMRRPAGKWIVDFGWEMDKAAASLYEAPFTYCLSNVQSARAANRTEHHQIFWWRHVRSRQNMWSQIHHLARYLVTPTIAKHRTFYWLPSATCPDHQLIVISRDDDTTFGILHSRFHEAWALRLCTWLGVGNDP